MCTRFVLLREHLLAVLKRLGLGGDPGYATRYNIAPNTRVPAIRTRTKRETASLRWGLVPAWAKEDVGFKLVNARLETVAEKPAFRDALRLRRCVVPATGFYEWQTVGRAKKPFLIRRRDEAPFAFAGLWETWHGGDGGPLETFSIITTEPNELMRPIHTRMPIMLTPEQCEPWLDDRLTDPARVLALLQPQAAETMQAAAVSRFVSNVRNEGPECLAPARPDEAAGDEPQLSLGL
ncbi:MAG: SOS response-associated peptidase [Verrucomicrobia bacterium]|nr:SOS response-associated peptidase [Verrucomicrobiota bacterium]